MFSNEQTIMNPFDLRECSPILNTEDLQTVLTNPPSWTNLVERRAFRSNTIIQNIISDCHSDSKIFLPRLRYDKRIMPKTLVCHDYKGGYLNDKYIYGPEDRIYGSCYTFYNWAQIDIFVYFSHKFITIPPLCWINAGHKNGVKVLGTLITEFSEGEKMCEKIFKDYETMQNFAKSLAQVTKVFGFDGWLLNIENPIKNVDILKGFVSYLTACIHHDDPENVVIWYDSVTEKGELKWQNELNSLNKCFFDACDGIFLNYVWTEKHMLNTVDAASHRNVDVYVGIDVFGRNTFGGGQFGCYKAAEMIRRHSLSMAIFAPGWTYETLEKDDDKSKHFNNFLNRDSAFWSSLWPYLFTHPVCDFFITNFDIGLSEEHHNVFRQRLQLSRFLHPKTLSVVPNANDIPTLNRKCNCLQCDVLNGNNVCLITNKDLKTDDQHVHHLFMCDLIIDSEVVIFALTRNVENSLTKLSFTMLTTKSSGSFRKIKLLAYMKEKPIDTSSYLEINPTTEEKINNKIGRTYYNEILEQKWIPTAYVFNAKACRILEVTATIEDGNSVYLCAFGMQSVQGKFFQMFY